MYGFQDFEYHEAPRQQGYSEEQKKAEQKVQQTVFKQQNSLSQGGLIKKVSLDTTKGLKVSAPYNELVNDRGENDTEEEPQPNNFFVLPNSMSTNMAKKMDS